MTAEMANAGATEREERRLRLKKVFLRALVVSLTSCALVAVGALLLGQFTQTTGKILATLGALAVHSGFAMACAAALERQRWPVLNRVAFVAMASTLGVLLTCIWGPGWFDLPTLRAAGTAWAVIVTYVVAIPCADLLERRMARVLAGAGLVAAVVALGMVLICIWAEEADNEAFGKATAIAGIAAFSFAHTALLVRVPGGGRLSGLLYGTMACVWLLAAMAAIAIIVEPQEEWWYRWMGAVGVLDACGSLTLLIVAKLRQVGRVEKLETTAGRVELRCPRCTVLQTVAVGASACTACGLKFRIDVEEPRCAKCDYLLWQLAERRCPECGTAF
jgi:ssDNA-binding Zn-finger/Zn-ribbon topoisomerase 1